MKASIKLREDKNPILRAKVPLKILGLPFRSGIEVGESKDLCLSLTAVFRSIPLLKLCFRPNDGLRPFGLAVKTGIGNIGSPIGAPITMSAEFNVFGTGCPAFFLHFKPQIGDFSVEQSIHSQILASSSRPSRSTNSLSDVEISDHGKAVGNEESFAGTAGKFSWASLFSGERASGFSAEKAVDEFLAGGDICARTALPVRDLAVLQLRWSIKYPAVDPAAATPLLRKIPYLVLSKIGVELVVENKKMQARDQRWVNGDAGEEFLTVKHEVDLLQCESEGLRKRIEELRSDIGKRIVLPPAGLTHPHSRNQEPGENVLA